MPFPLFIVDAFTSKPFGGNPAAVCLLDAAADPRWMQEVASEMNLAETAFVHPDDEVLRLRWFTPVVEVDLCGHATLAAAHALWESRRLRADAMARFQTRSGLLTATRRTESIELDFPSEPAHAIEPPAGLFEALGIAREQTLFVGQNRMDLIVELPSEAAVRALVPAMAPLAKLTRRGLIVTSRPTTRGSDFVSRFFAPSAGIPEDPATGSSHCCLAPYWAAKLGKTKMTGFQASHRGGTIGVELAGERVRLMGEAVTVVRGELAA